MRQKFRYFKNKIEFLRVVSSTKQVIDKDKLICSFCKSKEVLDIGCIDHSYAIALKLGNSWLHKQIKKTAKSVMGIDILKEDVKRLKNKGFNIIEADAENFDLKRKFDVIVAGDIIEHLSNIGSFLKSIEKHMHQNSVCIITTPNPFNIEQFMLAIFQNGIGVNDEHTVWLDPRVMYETISRTNLKITDFYWIKTRFKCPVRKRYYFANIFSEIIMKLRPICRRDYAIIVKKQPRNQ